jgi:maleate isomerase
MLQHDGWDVDSRIGILTCASDVGPESEIRAVAPPDVGVHVARVPSDVRKFSDEGGPTPAVTEVLDGEDLNAVRSSAAQLAAAPVAAIGICSTCYSYRIGRADEPQVVAEIRRCTRGLPVVTPPAAMVQALNSFEVHKLAIVSPPWFSRESAELGAQYFRDAGFRIGLNAVANVPGNQHLVTRADLYRWTVSSIPEDSEAVVIAGNGLRSIGVVGDLEAELSIHVFSANQVLLWALMSLAEASPQRVQGYGAVFRIPYVPTT